MGASPSLPELGRESAQPGPKKSSLPPIPTLSPQVPPTEPELQASRRTAIHGEVAACASWMEALHTHGCQVVAAADRLLESDARVMEVSPSLLVAATVHLSGEIQAHSTVSETHSGRCLSAARWCAAARSAGQEPLAAEVEANCQLLRSALLAHRGLLQEELVPRLNFLQQVHAAAAAAEKEAAAADAAAAAPPAR